MGKNQSLKPLKLIFAVLTLLLMLSLTMFGFVVWQQLKADDASLLRQTATTFLQHTERFFQHQEEILSQSGRVMTLRGRSYILNATPEMVALATYSARGERLYQSSTLFPETADTVLASAIQQSKNLGFGVIGSLYRQGLLNEPLLPLVVPVSAGGGVKNYHVALYRITGEHSIWHNLKIPENERLMLVGEDSDIRFRFPLKTQTLRDLFNWRLPVNEMDAIRRSFDEGYQNLAEFSLRGEKVIALTGYLPHFRLFVVADQPVPVYSSRWLNRMKPIGLVFVLFLAAAILVFRSAVRITLKSEHERAEAEAGVFKLSEAMDQNPNGVVVTDAAWLIEYANRRFKQDTGDEHPGESLVTFYPYTLLRPDMEVIETALRQTGGWYGERKSDQDNCWYSFSINRLELGETGHEQSNFSVIVQDISERKKAEEQLYKEANFDALTGLPNRRNGHQMLDEAISKAWHSGASVALFYLDVDNFKTVNDTFGHILGDQLLQLVGVRLQQAVSQQGVLVHLSGDEFMVFCHYQKEEEIIELAERARNAVKEPMLVDGKKLFITISIGISRYPFDSNDIDHLVKSADIALYDSKSHGRNRYCFYDSEMDQKAKRKLDIQTELRSALDDQELEMFYQTKNDIESGQVVGFEALMRWTNPRLGFVSPDAFIPEAEETGLIEPMGRMALIQACVDLVRLQDLIHRPVTMAINVSMQQLKSDLIIEHTREAIQHSGVAPETVELEITESLLAEDAADLIPRLNRLLELGVSLTIDDFGTGYSSLSYLNRFPVSTLKIDKCFVTDMPVNKGDETLTRTMIQLAHALGLKVVAEGIEDEKQQQMLLEFGCDIGQGYMYSRPLRFSDMTHHLKDGNMLPGWAI